MAKVNMIAQIVRLKQAVQRWKNSSLSPRAVQCHTSDSSPTAVVRRRTPPGSLAVYVGPERRRFVIPTRYLNMPVFLALLQQAEEEFGFQSSGGLVLPCEPGFFEQVVRLLEQDEERFRGLCLEEFFNVLLSGGIDNP